MPVDWLHTGFIFSTSKAWHLSTSLFYYNFVFLFLSFCSCDRTHGGFDCSVEIVSHQGTHFYFGFKHILVGVITLWLVKLLELAATESRLVLSVITSCKKCWKAGLSPNYPRTLHGGYNFSILFIFLIQDILHCKFMPDNSLLQYFWNYYLVALTLRFVAMEVSRALKNCSLPM